MNENISKDWPAITLGTIVFFNALVYFYLRIYPEDLINFAFVPQTAYEMLMSGQIIAVLKQYLLSMFTNQTPNHILSNMIPIYFVGVDIARRKGITTLLLLYFAGGLIVNLALTLLGFWSTTPVIGASGALAALFGFYLVTAINDIRDEYRMKLLIAPVILGLVLIVTGIYFDNWNLFTQVTGLLATLTFIFGVMNHPRALFWLIGMSLWVQFNLYELVMSLFSFYKSELGSAGHLIGIVIGFFIASALQKRATQN